MQTSHVPWFYASTCVLGSWHTGESCKKDELIRCCFGSRILDGVNVGTTWRMRLNNPFAVAMRAYVKLPLPRVLQASHYVSANRNARTGAGLVKVLY